MTPPLVDFSRLRALEDELSADDVRSLIGTFVETTQAMVSDLGTAIGSGATSEAARIAHRVKGGALAIGADALADLAGRVEAGGEVAATQLSALWDQTVQALHRSSS